MPVRLTLERKVDEERKVIRLLGGAVDPAEEAKDVVRFWSERYTGRGLSLYLLTE